jgi:hypothetical protein
MSAIEHQISVFGINFFLMNPLNNKRFDNKDMGLYRNRPEYKKTIDYYNTLDKDEQKSFNENLKQEATLFYKYYRSVVRNIVPYEHVLNYLNLNIH